MARVLDNFDDNTKTAWQDFSFPVGVDYASITESNGQLKFSLAPVGQSIFAASTKTSETFDLKEGRTIEFRVDLVSGNGADSFAVLSFIPTSSSASSLAGYGFAKSSNDILVTKGINKYFYNESPTVPVKNENVTMVLSLTVKDGNVIINTKVLDKDANNEVIFEKTFVDTGAAEVFSDGTDDPAAPYLGAGNFVLYCYEDDGKTQDSYDVTFDNAEVFITDSAVLDNFDDNTKTAWQDFTFPVGVTYASITEANGQFNFSLAPVGQSIFAASTKTSRTFDLVDGERLQFSVDLVSGNGEDSFEVLAFIPTSSSASSLAGYGFAKSTSDILITKGVNKYFYNENPPTPVKNENVTMVLTLTARNGNVEMDAKVLDKDNNNEVLFEKTFIDTPAADVFSDGTDDPAGPYLGSGNFVLYCYEDDGKTQDSYDVTFDNAVVGAPPSAANAPVLISEISPANFSNFLPATTTISFKLTDDEAIDDSKISVNLNGTNLTTSNGLTVTGSGNTRTVSLGGLSANQDYKAVINVTDAQNVPSSATIYFDTFDSANLVVEAEDYNFGNGAYINDPAVLPEGSFGDPTSYQGQVGEVDVDYHDTRADFQDAPYRPEDHVRMQHTLDVPRQKFVDQGGAPASVFDYDIGDIAAGEWLNYTRSFPAGNYNVYLRESLVNGTQAKAQLQQVTASATNTLGTFIVTTTGFDYRNVPLTDAIGQNKIVVALNGESTLRLVQVDGDPSDGNIYQNYLVFVPTTASAVQRATISSLAPASGATVETVSPQITAVIQNRDTTVNTNTIKLFVNGTQVNPNISSSGNETTLTYAITPLPASGLVINASIQFTDSQSVTQTNDWSFTITYRSLSLATRIAGTGETRGMFYHMVQAPFDAQPLENTLARAEAQLAPNSTIPKVVDTNTVIDVVNFNTAEADAGDIPGDILPPGLEPDINGVNDFAVEISAYLELTAGAHRFGVISDDGYKISVGSSLNDRNANPIAFHNGGTANESFDVYVPQDGLYPFRFVWYQRGGSGQAEWTSIDPETGNKVLVNHAQISAALGALANTVIKAYTTYTPDATPTLSVESSATVAGGYTADASAVIDVANKKITIPLPASNRFYRLKGSTQSRIVSSEVSSGNLVLVFE
jgi:hypothetical protein